MEDARLQARDEVGDYRRIEVITGRRRRRDWPDDEKARIVAESAEIGANVSAVARRHGLNRGVLTVWRRAAGLTRLKARPRSTISKPATFVPVEVEAAVAPRIESGLSSAPHVSQGRIEVELVGGRIVIDADADPVLARAVIAAVRCRR